MKVSEFIEWLREELEAEGLEDAELRIRGLSVEGTNVFHYWCDEPTIFIEEDDAGEDVLSVYP